MTPEPGKENIVSKVVFVGVVIILLLILGGCAFFIYQYIEPPGVPAPSPSPSPSPTPTPLLTPTPRPTYTPTPRPSVTPTPTPNSQYYQQDTLVTNGASQYYYPGIWDHYIIYDMDDGTKNYSMLYDIDSGQSTQIDSGTVFSYGAISNGKVMLYYPNHYQIVLYNIATKEHDVTSTDESNARGSITMFGSRLAYYQDMGSYGSDNKWAPDYCIYVFDMDVGNTYSIVQNLPMPLDIRIYNDELVYTVVNGTGSDIYFLKIDLGATKLIPKKITDTPGNNNHARIYGNTIVYHSDGSGEDHVYIYNINTGQTYMPAPNSEQRSADIYGNTVVYDDNRNGNWDIYAYDISTNTERQITNEPHDQLSPVVYDDHIAYMDNRNGNWDVYTLTLS